MLAKRFFVDDFPSASVPGTRLSNLLDAFSKGKQLSALGAQYLIDQGLSSLNLYLSEGISESQFLELAAIEQSARITAAKARQQVERHEADARQQAMFARLHAEKLQRESDPKFIARKKNRELRERYGVDGFVDEHDIRQLMAILRMLESGQRLSVVESEWLKNHDYDTEEILRRHNRLEADYFIAEFRTTGDAWQLVNASGHLRKCEASREAHELLTKIQDDALKQPKLKSAVRTTHGGVLRDLGRRDEALVLANEAHLLQPQNFRPCTLLGALHIEMGEMGVGHEWYLKAQARGAKPGSIEAEIGSLIGRMPREKLDSAINQLLRIDPHQYAWLRKRFGPK